jgi:hypothetical protein
MGCKKRHKKHPHGATTTTDHDDDNCRKAGGSSVGHIVTTAHGDKHQVRPPIDHFRRLLEDAFLNHTYPVRQKLKDCDMMKSFMISGSFTHIMELNKDPSGSDTMPFLGEEAIMTIYGGCLTLERRRMTKRSLGPPTRCGWGCSLKKQKTIIRAKEGRMEMRGHGHGVWPELSPTDRRRRPAPPVEVPGGGQSPSRPPGPTLETREYPRWATYLGQLGRWKCPRTTMTVAQPQRRVHP